MWPRVDRSTSQAARLLTVPSWLSMFGLSGARTDSLSDVCLNLTSAARRSDCSTGDDDALDGTGRSPRVVTIGLRDVLVPLDPDT
jgi:hypothetical protein